MNLFVLVGQVHLWTLTSKVHIYIISVFVNSSVWLIWKYLSLYIPGKMKSWITKSFKIERSFLEFALTQTIPFSSFVERHRNNAREKKCGQQTEKGNFFHFSSDSCIIFVIRFYNFFLKCYYYYCSNIMGT